MGDSIHGFLEGARRSRRMAHRPADQLEPTRVRTLGNAVVPAVGLLHQ